MPPTCLKIPWGPEANNIVPSSDGQIRKHVQTEAKGKPELLREMRHKCREWQGWHVRFECAWWGRIMGYCILLTRKCQGNTTLATSMWKKGDYTTESKCCGLADMYPVSSRAHTVYIMSYKLCINESYPLTAPLEALCFQRSVGAGTCTVWH